MNPSVDYSTDEMRVFLIQSFPISSTSDHHCIGAQAFNCLSLWGSFQIQTIMLTEKEEYMTEVKNMLSMSSKCLL